MKTVQQLLDSKHHRLVSVSPDTTVLDALKLMAEKEIGAVLVLGYGVFRYSGALVLRWVLMQVILGRVW